MGGGKRSSKPNAPRRSHLKVSPNDADAKGYSKKTKHHHHHSSKDCASNTRRSRKNRVHPTAMLHIENNNDGVSSNSGGDGNGQQRHKLKKKPNLTIETNGDSNNHDSERRSPSLTCSTPNGLRGSRDLRSPGMPKSPAVGEDSSNTTNAPATAIPDFITQTDASGNATTPRSSQAIDAARTDYMENRGEEDDDVSESNSSSSSKDMVETCDSIFDSFRLCCCLLQSEIDESNPKSISGKETQDSDDNIENKSTNNRPLRLLGSPHPDDAGKKCLVLDLDETLVHSSFRAVEGADFVIPVQIEDVVHFVYVAKRPGVDEFLVEMAKHYEIVIYTASLNKYADPLLDLLDQHKVIRYRLFRESCVFFEGNYVKDLSVLDRDLSSTIIIDNSPNSYLFHPENAIDCSSFIDDPRDRELDQIGSFLTGIKNAKDVRGLCHQWRDWPVINPIEQHDQQEIR